MTNKTGVDRSFLYNSKMCFESDARDWTNLNDVCETYQINSGKSTIIEIQENFQADSIAISYFDEKVNERKIYYANQLSVDSTLTEKIACNILAKDVSDDVKVRVLGKKNTHQIFVRIINKSQSPKTFYYTAMTCDYYHAKNWQGDTLSRIEKTPSIPHDESVTITVNGSIDDGFETFAFSYVSDNTRYVIYAANLTDVDTTNFEESTAKYYSYEKHGIEISLLYKNADRWVVDVKNKTNEDIILQYNVKMCWEDDAKNWKGLSNIQSIKLEANTNPEPIVIYENLFTTHIALSYIKNKMMYIIYANELSQNGQMNVHESTRPAQYVKNGIGVEITWKQGDIWKLNIENKTGKTLTFEYNSKMCFEGDAKDWKGLADVVRLDFTEETKQYNNLSIAQNGTATHIAISYVDGHYRYVFYADQLDSNGYMNAQSNIIDLNAPPTECVAEGSLITLADGTQKPVEELTGDELLLVWNLETGTYDYAPILFIDSDPIGHYEVINLTFSDNTQVNVISEHGFYDVDINQYVYLDKNAYNYIGHNFKSETGNVTLTNVEINTVVTRAYSPVTYGHLCYYVDGMLSMPGGIEGLFNYFDVDSNTMKYDEESKNADIQQYGLFTYEEFNELIPIPEEIFSAVNGQYLKVAIGKGMITLSQIQQLVNRYSVYF